MRDTVNALIKDVNFDEAEVIASIEKMVIEVQEYVPGYRLRGTPQFDGQRVTVFIEVEGAGDFFPAYSGNLDIMTAAAAKVANEMAKELAATNA